MNAKVLTLLTATSISLLSFSSAHGANKVVFSAGDKGTAVQGKADISRGEGDETHQTAGNNLPTKMADAK